MAEKSKLTAVGKTNVGLGLTTVFLALSALDSGNSSAEPALPRPELTQDYKQQLQASPNATYAAGVKIMNALTPVSQAIYDVYGLSDTEAMFKITDPSAATATTEETRLHKAMRLTQETGKGQVFGVSMDGHRYEYGVALHTDGSLLVVAREQQPNGQYQTIRAVDIASNGTMSVSPTPGTTNLSAFGLRDPSKGHLPLDPQPIKALTPNAPRNVKPMGNEISI